MYRPGRKTGKYYTSADAPVVNVSAQAKSDIALLKGQGYTDQDIKMMLLVVDISTRLILTVIEDRPGSSNFMGEKGEDIGSPMIIDRTGSQRFFLRDYLT